MNPLNSFDFGEIDVEIGKTPTSDELLKKTINKYSYFEKVIMLAIYHLINTQFVECEYLTVLTKDFRLIADLVEGEKNKVHLSDDVRNEGNDNNILIACHNHYFGAIIPSCEDILSIIIYGCQFAVISSENYIGIICNDCNEMVLEDIKRELLLFDKYIEFRFSIDCFDEIQLLDESSVDFKKLKLELYDKFVCRNNEKFVNEFNSRFNSIIFMRFILNYRGDILCLKMILDFAVV